MPMPLIKIGYLLLRTLAKPVASSVKKQAKDRPLFRAGCMRLAQLYHRLEVRLHRKIVATNGESIGTRIRPLQEDKAIALGAEFIGEAIIFGVAGALLLLEASRNHKAEVARRKAIDAKFEQLFLEVGAMDARLSRLEQSLDTDT